MEPVVLSFLSQHAEEASFLSVLRARAVAFPHLDLSDLRRLDERLDAHIDGLRLAENKGWTVCARELSEWHGAGEVFTAAVLACESRSLDRIEQVLEIGLSSEEHQQAFVAALGWLSWEVVQPVTKQLCASPNPATRCVALGGCALHRQNQAMMLSEAVQSEEVRLKASAIKAIGELGCVDFLSRVRSALNSHHVGCRFYAAWSATLLGDTAAVRVLCQFAEQAGEYAERAAAMAARGMPVSDCRAWFQRLAARQDQRRLAVIVAGAAGDPAYVPWLIEVMADLPLARVAGEAFSSITGAYLADAGLAAQRPEGYPSGPTEDPEDENVAIDPDEHLSWPDVGAIKSWWSQHGAHLPSGTRLLLGKPITRDWLVEVLRSGYQRQRAAAATELVLLRPGTPLFEVSAPVLRQMRLLHMRV